MAAIECAMAAQRTQGLGVQPQRTEDGPVHGEQGD